MFEVTLAQLRKEGACYDGYNKVVRMLQGKEFTEADSDRESYIPLAHKEPINLALIAENNGIDYAIWCLRCIKGHDRDARLFAVWCARQVRHLMMDNRSIAALDIAERFANGEATEEELAAAWVSAKAAAWASASAAAWVSAKAAAWASAWVSAWVSAWAAAWASARAAAWDVTRDAAWASAREAAMAAQKEMFIKMCNGEAPWQVTSNSKEA